MNKKIISLMLSVCLVFTTCYANSSAYNFLAPPSATEIQIEFDKTQDIPDQLEAQFDSTDGLKDFMASAIATGKRPNKFEIISGLQLYSFMVLIQIVSFIIFYKLHMPLEADPRSHEIINLPILIVLPMIILKAFIEEVMYRWGIYNTIKYFLSKLKVNRSFQQILAITGQAFLFSFMHNYSIKPIFHFINRFNLGIFLQLTVIRHKGSLWPSYIAHVLFNVTNLIIYNYNINILSKISIGLYCSIIGLLWLFYGFSPVSNNKSKKEMLRKIMRTPNAVSASL